MKEASTYFDDCKFYNTYYHSIYFKRKVEDAMTYSETITYTDRMNYKKCRGRTPKTSQQTPGFAEIPLDG